MSEIQRRGLPAELLVELYKCLPMDYGIAIMLAVPSAIIVYNNGPILKRQLEQSQLAKKINEWNVPDGQPLTVISIVDGDNFVTHHGPNDGRQTIRAEMPFRTVKWAPFLEEPYIVGYYETEILNIAHLHSNTFGFCDRQFPLEGGWLGEEENSIGIWDKEGIWIEGRLKKFENDERMDIDEDEDEDEDDDEYFINGDTIGIGLVHYPADSILECFATCNGHLLGSIELPEKFSFGIELYPAIFLYGNGDSFRTNFGMDQWLYDPHEMLE